MEKRMDDDISRLSPDSLMDIFSKSNFVATLLVSVGLHLILGVATSVGYVYRTYIHEEKPKTGTEAAASNKTDVASASNTTAAASNATTTAATTGAPPANAALSSEQALMEQHKNTPVVQRINETAKPEELPSQTNTDIGISIQDTNPF